MPGTPMRNDFSRTFIIEGRAAPNHAPSYGELVSVSSATHDQGKVASVYIPDPNRYGAFKLISKVPGEPTLPELTLEAYYTEILSTFLRLVESGCDNDVQVHFGSCTDPRDFDHGWQKMLILEGARADTFSTNGLGALQPSNRASILETSKFSGLALYEIGQMIFAEKAAAQVYNEVVGIEFCDAASCGTCGILSDGCQIVFAVSQSSGGSPGLLAAVVFSTDGGRTWVNAPVTSLGASNAPNDIICVGSSLLVLSAAAVAVEWTNIADLIAGVNTWAAMTTGFVAAHGPTRAFSPSSSYTYFVGKGGYIYFSSDPTSSVSVLDPGTLTVQDYNDIAGVDILTFMAVGNSNVVVYSVNGGSTISAVTGPAPGVNLTTCYMHDAQNWMVGTAGGKLYYTYNSGQTWSEKSFPGSGAGVVRDIKFATPSVGYMSHDVATPKGRILRTTNGGYSWYVLPEGTRSMPNNQRFTALATCVNPNVVMAGGLSAGGTDGIIVAGAA